MLLNNNYVIYVNMYVVSGLILIVPHTYLPKRVLHNSSTPLRQTCLHGLDMGKSSVSGVGQVTERHTGWANLSYDAVSEVAFLTDLRLLFHRC